MVHETLPDDVEFVSSSFINANSAIDVRRDPIAEMSNTVFSFHEVDAVSVDVHGQSMASVQ